MFARMATCPTCKGEVPEVDLTYQPFCSRRCKMVDLGRWFGESYRVAGPPALIDADTVAGLDDEELARIRTRGDA